METNEEKPSAKPNKKTTKSDRHANDVKLRLTRMSKAVIEELRWSKSTSAMDMVGKNIQRDRNCAGS